MIIAIRLLMTNHVILLSPFFMSLKSLCKSLWKFSDFRAGPQGPLSSGDLRGPSPTTCYRPRHVEIKPYWLKISAFYLTVEKKNTKKLIVKKQDLLWDFPDFMVLYTQVYVSVGLLDYCLDLLYLAYYQRGLRSNVDVCFVFPDLKHILISMKFIYHVIYCNALLLLCWGFLFLQVLGEYS